jgi:hypothetical protein
MRYSDQPDADGNMPGSVGWLQARNEEASRKIQAQGGEVSVDDNTELVGEPLTLMERLRASRPGFWLWRQRHRDLLADDDWGSFQTPSERREMMERQRMLFERDAALIHNPREAIERGSKDHPWDHRKPGERGYKGDDDDGTSGVPVK